MPLISIKTSSSIEISQDRAGSKLTLSDSSRNLSLTSPRHFGKRNLTHPQHFAWQFMPLDEAPILVICDDTQLRNALTARIARAHGHVVFGGSSREALQRIEQVKFTAVVLVHQSDTDPIAAWLRENNVPSCVLDTAATKPVNVSAKHISPQTPVASFPPSRDRRDAPLQILQQPAPSQTF